MKNNGKEPTSAGSQHWLEFMPGYAYCFVPSLHDRAGVIKVCSSKPEFISEFEYTMKIEKVCIPNLIQTLNIYHHQVGTYSYDLSSSSLENIDERICEKNSEQEVRTGLK